MALVQRVRRCRADKARAFIAPGCQVSSCALWRTEYSPQWGQICFEFFLLLICVFKLKKIQEDSLDLISSPSTLNYGRKRCKGQILLDVVNKRLNTKSFLTMPSNVLPLHFTPQANIPANSLNFH